jgi:V/A-type H+-transporting ATPase subunit E
MRSEYNDIQALKSAIKGDARGEADQVLADAQARAEDIRQQAEAQADAECEAILKRARQEAEAQRSHAAAAAQLEAQTLKLKRREQLLERVFADARRQLASAPQWPYYEQIVRRLVREAVERLGADEVLVRADEGTRKVLDDDVLADLGEELGIHLRVGEPLAQGTGIVLETPDGHRRYDNTLETRLAHMQNRLRAPVYHILMGETS